MSKNILMKEKELEEGKTDKSERYWDIWHGSIGEERAQGYPIAYGPPHDPEPAHRGRMELASSLIVGNSVLDIGCGIGHLRPFVKEGIKYTGADTSFEMLQVAKRFHPNGIFCVGDIYDLSPFRMFDTVLCQSVLIHLPKIETPIQEMWNHACKAIVFSIPIANIKTVKPLQQYENKSILMHTETWENIETIVKALDRVKGVERHLESGTKIGNTYIRILK